MRSDERRNDYLSLKQLCETALPFHIARILPRTRSKVLNRKDASKDF